jgi:hypothetical protein
MIGRLGSQEERGPEAGSQDVMDDGPAEAPGRQKEDRTATRLAADQLEIG